MQTCLQEIRTQNPLILNITNSVTVNFIANGLLNLGASPLMTQSIDETIDLLKLSHALVINIGTLNKEFMAHCHEACKIANELKKPIILDPVGAGASRFRTESALALLNAHAISIVRGNASEINALVNFEQITQGTDSLINSEAAIQPAQVLSQQYNTAIVVSGKTDYIIDQNSHQIQESHHGSSLMPKITGTGCLLTAVIGAFHAIEKDRFKAAYFATVFYGLCGEKAHQRANTPALFQLEFLNALYA